MQSGQLGNNIDVEGILVAKNLVVDAVVFEHDPRTATGTVNVEQALRTGKYTSVVPEFYPPDLQGTIRSLVSDEPYKDLQQVIEDSNAHILCLDPAHNSEFVKAFAAETSFAILGTSLFVYSNTTSSRRDFLKLFGAVSLVGATGTALKIAEHITNEPLRLNSQDLRRVVIAEKLLRISQNSKNLNEPSKILLAYPKAHIEGIKYWLQYPDQAKVIAKAVYGLFPSFSQIREYQVHRKPFSTAS